MNIADLQPRQGKIDLEATIVKKGTVRPFQKEASSGKVCTARIKDDSGEIDFTLWNEQVDQVNEGDVVKITNGYVNEWQGEKQLSTGKFGKLELVKKGSTSPSSHSTKTTTLDQHTSDAKQQPQQLRTNIPPQPPAAEEYGDGGGDGSEGSGDDISVDEEEI